MEIDTKCSGYGQDLKHYVRCENPECKNHNEYFRDESMIVDERSRLREEVGEINKKIGELKNDITKHHGSIQNFHNQHTTSIRSVENRLERLKINAEWTETRLGALQIFIGALLAIYLTFVPSPTDDVLALAIISLFISFGLVYLSMGVGRRGTMRMMDFLTLSKDDSMMVQVEDEKKTDGS